VDTQRGDLVAMTIAEEVVTVPVLHEAN